MATSKTKMTVEEKEKSLKLEQLAAQVETAKLDLRKRKRDDRNAAEATRLDMRTKRAAAEKAETEARNAARLARMAEVEDSLNCEYFFSAVVTPDSIRSAISDLNKVSRLNPGKPLTVVLNSPGGSVIDGLALYDHIRDLSGRGHHMTVKVRGMAASMGGILLQAGDTRVVGPEALVLIHEVSGGALGRINDMEDRIAHTRRLWDRLADILSRGSKRHGKQGMTAEEIQTKAHKFDWWLDGNEAVALGFADQVG